jgi:5-methylcytosine-specific restriction protein B
MLEKVEINPSKAEYVYELYNQFVNECILKDNSVLTNEEDIFSLPNLEKVKNHFIDGAIEGNETYWEKVKKQFEEADYSTRLCFAHLNWLWYLPANDITINTKKDTPLIILEKPEFKAQFESCKKENFYPKEGVGSAGQYHKTNKPFEIAYLLLLCIKLKQEVQQGILKTTEEVNQKIVEIAGAIFDTNWYTIDDAYYQLSKGKSLAMQSLILHLAKPSYYDPIASMQHKEAIRNSFEVLLQNNPDDSRSEAITIDDEIYQIKQELIKLGIQESFYSSQLLHIWQNSLRNSSSEMMSLQYKKAMVFYGPPGTGKTFTATNLAKTFITNHYLHKKENLNTYFSEGLKNIEDRIHLLQFNPNTTYEDFIAGYHLKATKSGTGSETVAVKGQLFDIIDKANDEIETTDEAGKIKLPHVLILDEINRVDLSRVFGEFFSAMENRNKPIETAVKGITLCVPDNLFIIGTMNEIDFSVERVDFALRRRFVWQFKGYDENALIEMLSTYFDASQFEGLQEKFVEQCNAVNHYISNEITELGEDYQIGHAFFAELSKIFEEHKNLTGKSRSKQLLFKEAKTILWNISIKPMLVAFLGNTDKETIKEHSEKLAQKFGIGK